jgi:predicted nucleotidyltransferase
MSAISLEKLKPTASNKVQPFLDEILNAYRDRVHSIYITGSAITEDFHEERSDVNSIIVLKTMDLKFLELLAPLGKKYAKRRIAAPLIMTPEYIRSSLDVFPIEFLNFRLIHTTVFGEDILDAIEIGRLDLRQQCERELKVKLIWLRQGYLSSLGDRKILTESFVNSITGYIPLFRGIIFLLGGEPPVGQGDVISALSRTADINTDVFARVLREKKERIKLSLEELNTIFEDYYSATEKIGKKVDEITV